MTITQAAAMLGKSEITLRRWIDSEYMQAVKIGKMWEISADEIERIKAGESSGKRPGSAMVSK